MVAEDKKKYKYEVHFPYSKQIFMSSDNMNDFVTMVTYRGAKNIHGQLVCINKDMITYIVQSDSNLKF